VVGGFDHPLTRSRYQTLSSIAETANDKRRISIRKAVQYWRLTFGRWRSHGWGTIPETSLGFDEVCARNI
jgi:hypothetical protein